MQLPIGGMNRPWYNFPLPVALEGIAAAGFTTTSLCVHQGKVPITSASSPEELEALRGELQRCGLTFQMLSCAMKLDGTVAQGVEDLSRTIAHVARLGGRYVLSCGVAEPALYEKWYAVMREACDAAAEWGIEMTLKPHGGLSATADDLLRALDRVDRPNFSLCYDPGNITYYTGRSGEAELGPVADRVSCLCIKDIRGGRHGDVMITPGTGEVDFEAIFGRLREAGFRGPSWIECVAGRTVAEINAEYVKARAFIEGVLGRL